MTTKGIIEKYFELFSELEACDEEKQKQKIEEMNKIMEDMGKEEYYSVFKKDLLFKISKMIEERKISMENALVLLKQIGYCNVLMDLWSRSFEESSLKKKIEKLKVEEEEKKEEKNEMLLVDLCECYVSLSYHLSFELTVICVPCLLKVVSVKEENEKTQKEVEIALLALSSIRDYYIEQKLYLKEIKEIIVYHQKHCNLTRLAYQSAWKFLMDRFYEDKRLEEVITNELHFSREATKELEELIKCMDWKKKEEEEKGKEAKEKYILVRWLKTLISFFYGINLWNEEFAELIGHVVQIFRASRENYRTIGWKCICLFQGAVDNRAMKVVDFLKGGAVDAALEEIQQQTVDNIYLCDTLRFFHSISRRLKRKIDNKAVEVKRRELKRKIFKKMEEEGYEDIITSFHKRFHVFNELYYRALSLNIPEYFVFI